jgi:hypothetical protein
VPDHVGPLDSQRVEKRDLVARERLAVIAAAGCLGRTEPTQLGGEQSELAAQAVDHTSPHPPGLRPAVEQEDRRCILRAGLDEVDAEAPGVDVAMLDILGGGRVGAHGRHSRHGSPALCAG